MEATDRVTQLLRAAETYRERGWSPTPVRGKKAYLPDWSSRSLPISELRRELWLPERGIGLVLGKASSGLVDVDLDCDEALEVAPALLPFTPMVHGRQGRPWSHWWYVCPGVATAQCRGPDGLGMIVELRADGTQTCVPPSRHPTGETLRWEAWGTPAQLEASVLRRQVGLVALAAYLRWTGWSLPATIHFARAPDERVLLRLERLPQAPPLRAWIGMREPRRRPCPAREMPTQASQSPYTAAILARIDVVGTGALLGLDLKPDRQQRCPLHDDHHASLQVANHLWHCHAGCGSGTAIHLVAHVLRIDYRAARNWLAEKVGLDWRDYWRPAS